MRNGNHELDELSREINKIISENKKFLEKVTDEEFETDDSDEIEEEINPES